MIGTCLVCSRTFEGTQEDCSGPNAMCVPCYKKRQPGSYPPGWQLSPPPMEDEPTEEEAPRAAAKHRTKTA